MISYKEWKIKEMAGTGAIYNGEKGQSKKRDYNWWGDPESAGMTQDQAHNRMEKSIKKSRKK